MELITEKVSLISGNKKRIKEIYESSFHKEDQMPFPLMLMMACLRSTRFISFREGEMIRGFVYMATISKITFVMFFAVDEHVRSKGYGSCILSQIQSMFPDNKIIVTIEKCDRDTKDIDEKSRRRQFYLRNGYVQAGYTVKLGSQEQEILIKNGEFIKREFILFFLRYSNLTILPKVRKIAF